MPFNAPSLFKCQMLLKYHKTQMQTCYCVQYCSCKVYTGGINGCRESWEKAEEKRSVLGVCHKPKYCPQPCVSRWHAIRLSYPTVDLCPWHTRSRDTDKWLRVPLVWLYSYFVSEFQFSLYFFKSLLSIHFSFSHSPGFSILLTLELPESVNF